jgi:hypothetical protein
MTNEKLLSDFKRGHKVTRMSLEHGETIFAFLCILPLTTFLYPVQETTEN